MGCEVEFWFLLLIRLPALLRRHLNMGLEKAAPASKRTALYER
jgi:hypothetical protein